MSIHVFEDVRRAQLCPCSVVQNDVPMVNLIYLRQCEKNENVCALLPESCECTSFTGSLTLNQHLFSEKNE